MKKEQKDKLIKARAILSNVIKGESFEKDELTGENRTFNSLLVEAENLISEVNETIFS